MHSFNMLETISTLEFGKRAKSIKNNVKVNEQRSIKELEKLIENLTSQLNGLKIYVNSLERDIKIKDPNYNLEEVRKTCKLLNNEKPKKMEEESIIDDGSGDSVEDLISISTVNLDGNPRLLEENISKYNNNNDNNDNNDYNDNGNNVNNDEQTPNYEELITINENVQSIDQTMITINSENNSMKNSTDDTNLLMGYDPLELAEMNLKLDKLKEEYEVDKQELLEEIQNHVKTREKDEKIIQNKTTELENLNKTYQEINTSYQQNMNQIKMLNEKHNYELEQWHIREQGLTSELNLKQQKLIEASEIVEYERKKSLEFQSNLENELKEIKYKLDQKEREIIKQNESYKTLHDNNMELDSKINNQDKSIRNYEENISQLKLDRDTIKKDKELMKIEMKEKENQIQLSQQNLKEKEENLSRLLNMIESSEKEQIEKMSRVSQENEKLKEEILSLKRESFILQSELEKKELARNEHLETLSKYQLLEAERMNLLQDLNTFKKNNSERSEISKTKISELQQSLIEEQKLRLITETERDHLKKNI